MANTGAKWTTISQTEFDKIKGMQQYGLKAKQIRDILGNNRGPGTINQIKQFDTLEAYRTHLRYIKARSLAKKRLQTKPPVLVKTSLSDVLSTTTVPPVPMFEFRDVPQSNPEVILTRIAMGIERLADAWEASPNKRRLF